MTTKGRALSESVTAPRQRLLAKLKAGQAKVSPRNLPLRWALAHGFARPSRLAKHYEITPEGMAKLSYAEMDRGLRAALRTIPRLVGKILCRTSSDTEEAVTLGGGYVYHTEPDQRSFPTQAARLLIANGLVVPRKDGLLDGISQTFRLPAGGPNG